MTITAKAFVFAAIRFSSVGLGVMIQPTIAPALELNDVPIHDRTVYCYGHQMVATARAVRIK